MQTITLTAEPRGTGTSAARATRREGRVPAVLYGPHAEPVHFSLAALDMRPLVHTTETYRIALKLDGQTLDCVLKHVDYDPVTSLPAHADFYALTKGEKLTLTVPVLVVGNAPGVREGGDLMQPLHEIEVRCLPKDIPGHIEVDVSNLNVGDAIHVGDLAFEGVEIHGDPALPVVLVAGKKPEVLEEEAALQGEGAEAEGAEGEEA
jgi:large subunit ribosomal protein L25